MFIMNLSMDLIDHPETNLGLAWKTLVWSTPSNQTKTFACYAMKAIGTRKVLAEKEKICL